MSRLVTKCPTNPHLLYQLLSSCTSKDENDAEVAKMLHLSSKHIETTSLQEALEELQVPIHHDQGLREEMQHMSETVFLVMCQIVGTSRELAIRRETRDFREMILRLNNDSIVMVSGTIGHPLGPHEHEEWRFSFSQAEYKLVCSMNHYESIMKSEVDYDVELVIESSKTLRYREALSVIEMTKVKLAQPYLMYRETVDRERHIDTTLSQAALDELQVLVHHDQGRSEGMYHMSESVFRRMCRRVGTSQQVAMRRELQDIREMSERQEAPNDRVITMLSGSMREGFRLKGSDVDLMYWLNNHRVIMNMSQSKYYNTAKTTFIFSDSSESPPGFTLLQLLTPLTIRSIQSACVGMNGRVYISSSIYRQLTCSEIFLNSSVHGPCGSGNIGGRDYDTAWCFVCDFWPSFASSWIDRCMIWPNSAVVEDIVRNGCHFVAIGHPLGPNENNEWRISFSQAEYKLVYSMNHCQFLTYGLLKLFLKEVINQQAKDTNKLLCSYHMKTTVFWAIQQNLLSHWCPQNFLAGFWVCFKLLLKWVYEGVCPNFFIPQNNLFLTKVHGSAQKSLFLWLHGLYNKGLACLLQSSSIRSYIIDVLYNPRLSICTSENMMISEVDYDVELVREFSIVMCSAGDEYGGPTEIMHNDRQLINSPLTQNQVVMLQRVTTLSLQKIAFVLHNMYTYVDTSVNKQLYIADKMSCHMLKLAVKFGCISDMLYIVMYYYTTYRYQEALSVIQKIKAKLAQPYLMYERHVDRERYTEAVGGQSWSKKMKQAVAVDIVLNNRICYISELIPEQNSALQKRWSKLTIPVFVMLHFLKFLCYRHVDTTVSQEALDELQVLVHHDQGLYVLDLYRDISWEILGICQQITGNLQAALYSYQQSLTQYPYNKIQTATQRRIHEVEVSDLHQLTNAM
ncbi:uncharacterized protein LOC128191417 [Crassostrea angulata]|uniref:uncharacterized protein LOC128191417 n=1 Tax=Magallana angulata TaxID=2784310 RepID=UPI0022B2105B|nr:uncharacterized protein LOC128191417 [Crassostrea angulata]